MPPLTRQRTLESVLSWWSDSNPSGATINLHAATKPLMKLMYHRQALGFVKRNRGLPMSLETLEIYWSYLSYGFFSLVDFAANLLPRWKYVSTSTKLAILEELITRARSEEDARVLIHSNIVNKLVQLQQSLPVWKPYRLLGMAAGILWQLASHSKSTSAAVNEPLVALLRESDVSDVARGFELLGLIANSPVGAEGIVAANALHYLLEGLGSPSPDVRAAACGLTQALAQRQSTAAAVMDLNPCKQIVALSRQVDMDIRQAQLASYALVAIANWPDGAEAAVTAQVLDHVPKWFSSWHYGTRQAACQLVEKLARHKSTVGAVMDLEPCERLVTILELDTGNYLAFCALEALGSIANWPNGAEAVVAAKALDHLTKSLVSRLAYERRSACRLLAALARHESTVQAVAGAVPRERLVALLRNDYELARKSAAKALQALDNYLTSAQAPIDEAGEPNVL
ncbi:armadillo-type protein [Mycena latifolia]|nr:armadillo-type protein [Mycena latifolia]